MKRKTKVGTARKTLPRKPCMARALVRIESVRGRKVCVVVPGWNHRVVVEADLDLPKKFRVKGYRFFARVNLAAEHSSNLNISAPFEAGAKGGRTRLTSKKISATVAETQAPKLQPKRRPFTCEFCGEDLFTSDGALTCPSCDPEGRHAEWPPQNSNRHQLFGRAIARAILRDFPHDDHTECNHDAGHCQYSTAFALLMRSPLYTTQAVPPSLQKAELFDMQMMFKNLRSTVERVVSVAYASEPVSSRSPLGSALNQLTKLDQYAMVGLARIDATDEGTS